MATPSGLDQSIGTGTCQRAAVRTARRKVATHSALSVAGTARTAVPAKKRPAVSPPRASGIRAILS